MSTPVLAAEAHGGTTPTGLGSREFTVSCANRLTARALRASQRKIETLVAKVSIHGDPMIYDPGDFPWVAKVESEWRLIRAELDAVMPHRERMPDFQEILTPVGAIQNDHEWKTFWLAGIGIECAGNRRRCPETTRILAKIPAMKTAFFSILSPGKHIPAHRGAYNGILRFHLGLIVPEPRERCRIRIGDEVRSWEEGSSLLFDDTFNHEVWNDTAGFRAILFVDFARPLRRPFDALDERLLSVGKLAPFLREASDRQRRWERGFYR